MLPPGGRNWQPLYPNLCSIVQGNQGKCSHYHFQECLLRKKLPQCKYRFIEEQGRLVKGKEG
jgi:hypothetical protein